MDTIAEYKRLAAELYRLSAENAELRTMAWPQFAPSGSKQEKYGFMSIEGDSPGFQFTPLARRFGFMDYDNPGFPNPALQRRFGFMDTHVQSPFTDGLANGVGFGVGVGIAAAAAVGIIYLLKRK